MDQIIAIAQAAALAVGALALVLVFIGVLLVLQLLSRFLTPRDSQPPDVDRTEPEEPQTAQEPELVRELERSEPVPTPRTMRPIYDMYPQIYRFEILYWRGVSKPWWWNNYAQDLLNYWTEYFPHKKVNLSISYNSNSKSRDYNTPSLQRRIVFLRTKKLSKHPLVIINHDQDYIMVDSYPALEAMKDRIDAEWLRHYGSKKTYRHSPTEY